MGELVWFDCCAEGIWNDFKYTPELLNTFVNSFDPSKRRVSLHIGHPMGAWDEQPALGWAKGFRIDGDKLQCAADPSTVHPDLRDGVNSEQFPCVSLEWWDNIDGDGVPKVTGVGFLGASQPAVSGLRPFKLSAADTKRGLHVAVYERDEPQRSQSSQRAKPETENENKTEGGEEGMDKKELTAKELREIGEEAVTAAKPEIVRLAAENAVKVFKDGEEYKALSAKAAKADELQGQLDALKLSQKRGECDAFAQELLGAGQITPAELGEKTVDGKKTCAMVDHMVSLNDEQLKSFKSMLSARPKTAAKLFDICDNDGETTDEAEERQEGEGRTALAASKPARISMGARPKKK